VTYQAVSMQTFRVIAFRVAIANFVHLGNRRASASRFALQRVDAIIVDFNRCDSGVSGLRRMRSASQGRRASPFFVAKSDSALMLNFRNSSSVKESPS
jgi:hypothetical protein